MHRFRITVEPVSEEHSSQEALHFEVTNHDDILEIVSRRPSRFGLAEDETNAMMVGLKLLSEIVLKHRTREPFSELRPALREFTLRLKGEQRDGGNPDAGHRMEIAPEDTLSFARANPENAC